MSMPTEDVPGVETRADSVQKPPFNSKMSWIYQGMAAAACIAFGIAMIANAQLANDGGWYWYAVLHHGGKLLYADLHMVTQPFIVLETEAWLVLAGKGWILSKVPALLHLLAFVAGIALINAESRLSDLQKAITLLCVFFVGIHFEHYRFDDYHVIFHSFFLFSVLILLRLRRGDNPERNMLSAAVLGLLCGLATMTRLTDGAALTCCTALALICILKLKRAISLAVFSVVALLTMRGIVWLTGDSLGSYLTHSVLGAAGPKGGASNVLIRPLLLPWNSLTFFHEQELTIVLLSAVVGFSWAFLISPFSKATLPASTIKAVVGVALLAVSTGLLLPVIKGGGIVDVLSALWVLVAYVLALLVLWRFTLAQFTVGGDSNVAPMQLILLQPIALILTGAMSTGGLHFGLYAPIAFFILLLPVIFPQAFEVRWFRSGYLALAVLMTISGAYFRYMDPASWNNYRTFPMFSNRQIVRHPVYGPMVIDKELNRFAEGICSIVNDGGKTELLSTPYSFANYYCDIPPWQGFVQTFFDTAGKDSIDDMLAKLRQSPPKWILYERQLDNLEGHENLYNHGRRLPYRDLDDFFVEKVYSGQWQVVAQQENGLDAWILLRTN
jgi:hypothetical protein